MSTLLAWVLLFSLITSLYEKQHGELGWRFYAHWFVLFTVLNVADKILSAIMEVYF